MTADTANPRSARDHARAMTGSKVMAMPVLPPTAADVPGVPVWEETIAPGGYASRRIARGTRLRLVDVEGEACASMLVFNAEAPFERLNVADTIKVQWNGYLGVGSLLLSDMGRAMASLIEDDAGTHDAFCGPGSRAADERRIGGGSNALARPGARDRLLLAIARHGLGRRDIHPCINWFKGVRIAADGTTEPQIGPFAPARAIVLRAEMDLIVAIANCPHVLDPRPDYRSGRLRASAWRGAVTQADDAVRLSTPERLRAFLNTEDYYRR